MSVDVLWLGKVDFDAGLEIQEERRAKVAEGNAFEAIFLLEHEPIYTMGRNPNQSSLPDRVPLPHPIRRINRGGQATYHGPGQLVAYPIFDLRLRGRDLHAHLRTLEGAVIETLAHFGLKSDRREGLTGVWVEDRKIASIGVGVRQWISMHGIALNISNDLAPFSSIIPCGIQGVSMTSLLAETGSAPGVREAGEIFATHLQRG